MGGLVGYVKLFQVEGVDFEGESEGATEEDVVGSLRQRGLGVSEDTWDTGSLSLCGEVHHW